MIVSIKRMIKFPIHNSLNRVINKLKKIAFKSNQINNHKKKNKSKIKINLLKTSKTPKMKVKVLNNLFFKMKMKNYKKKN